MAVISTGSHPKALWPGVYQWWGQRYDEYDTEWTDLVEKKSSTKNYEEVVQSTGFPLAVVKDQGAPVTYSGTHKQGSTTRFTHVVYALGWIVTWEEKEDNLYSELARGRVSSNVFSMHQSKENVVANLYNRAFSATFPIADGTALINAAHPLVGGGTQSNLGSGDISEAALEDLSITIMGAQNDEGNKISLMAESLHVPRQLWYKAHRILKSVLQNDTANNAVNALRLTNTFPQGIKLNHYFTDADAWFIRTNIMYGGLCLFQRHELERLQDNDFDTKNAKAYSLERYSVGVSDWRSLYGSPGA